MKRKGFGKVLLSFLLVFLISGLIVSIFIFINNSTGNTLIVNGVSVTNYVGNKLSFNSLNKFEFGKKNIKYKVNLYGINYLTFKANGENISLMWTQVYDKVYYQKYGIKTLNSYVDFIYYENYFTLNFNGQSLDKIIESATNYKDIKFDNYNDQLDYLRLEITNLDNKEVIKYDFNLINTYLTIEQEGVIF